MTDTNSALLKRIKRQVVGKYRKCFAVTTPGMEQLTEAELSALELSNPSFSIETGGVNFTTKHMELMNANLHLRTANRILMRLTAFKVEGMYRLEQKLADIAWELFFYRQQKINVHVTCRHSRLYHSNAVAQRVLNSINNRQAEMIKGPPDSAEQQVFVRIINNHLTLSLDTSGDPLYKRGLKRHGGFAPLRETLAAAILKIADYCPQFPLLDPMCGSGSFALEAAMMAKNMAPGLARTFAFTHWPAFQSKQWDYLKQMAQEKIIQTPHANIFASDFHKKAVEALSDCLKMHNLYSTVEVRQMDFFDLNPKELTSQKGLLVLNPPYGVRLGNNRSATSFFSKLAYKLKSDYDGWKVAVLVPQNAVSSMKPLALKSLSLIHGGLSIVMFWGKVTS